MVNCYFKQGSFNVTNTIAGACSAATRGNKFQTCCGIGQTCLSNGLCQFFGYEPGGSGYYLAGCTDPNFKDGSCYQNCSNNLNPDTVYDYGAQAWRCCSQNSDGSINCSNPETKTFPGPAPANLQYVATIVSAGTAVPLQTGIEPLTTSAAGSTIVITAGPGQTGTSSQQAVGGPGLTPGAAAGITVGAIVAILGLLALALFFLWRARGKPSFGNKPTQYEYPLTGSNVEAGPNPELKGYSGDRRAELAGQIPGSSPPNPNELGTEEQTRQMT